MTSSMQIIDGWLTALERLNETADKEDITSGGNPYLVGMGGDS